VFCEGLLKELEVNVQHHMVLMMHHQTASQWLAVWLAQNLLI
jgi:hypothetical protein